MWLTLRGAFERVEFIGQEEGKLKPNPRCRVTSQKTENWQRNLLFKEELDELQGRFWIKRLYGSLGKKEKEERESNAQIPLMIQPQRG